MSEFSISARAFQGAAAAAVDLPEGRGTVLGLAGLAHLWAHEYAACIHTIDVTKAPAREHDVNLSRNHLELGDVERAIGHLEPVEAELRRTGDPWMRWRSWSAWTRPRRRSDSASDWPRGFRIRVARGRCTAHWPISLFVAATVRSTSGTARERRRCSSVRSTHLRMTTFGVACARAPRRPEFRFGGRTSGQCMVGITGNRQSFAKSRS